MSHGRRISVVGLGYVGLPVALAFARQGEAPVVAFDIATARIAELRRGHDRTGEVAAAALADANLRLTDDPADLAAADFHIVTVPTPIDAARRPDLAPLVAASVTVGRQLRPGGLVVYESTVYPGATEEVCVPILERESGLVCGRDFSVGYSPERINPGDRAHRFETIVKVVSGLDAATLEIVASVYGSVVTAGVHRAPSIRTAEAAKVIENTQRDLNIALMNELALIFHRLGIDTQDVLAAAATKWNFQRFAPGLVGGHCIGVDPYYLTHRAEEAGYHPQVILSGRRINDSMGAYIAAEGVKHLLRAKGGGKAVAGRAGDGRAGDGRTGDGRAGDGRAGDGRAGGFATGRATLLGLTFKENVPDVRNSRAAEVAAELASYGLEVQVCDPLADPEEARRAFGLSLTPVEALEPADLVVLAVAHDPFRAGGWDLIRRLLPDGRGLVMDVRGCLDRDARPEGIDLWRL